MGNVFTRRLREFEVMVSLTPNLSRYLRSIQEPSNDTLTSSAAESRIQIPTNRIYVSGPCLHPEHVVPKVCQKQKLTVYFRQFGRISNVNVNAYEKSTVTFDSCDSVAKCIQQRTHKIGGHDFVIWETTPTEPMRKKLVANQEENWSSENVPPGLTNRIIVTGPCLHPEKTDPKAAQRETFRVYFSRFGNVTVGYSHLPYSPQEMDARISFDNCEAAAKCIQQRTHTIRGQDFIVREEAPTKCMKDKIKAIMRQNMPGTSSENASAANVQSDPAAESNLGNQSPQLRASSFSPVQGESSSTAPGSLSKEW
ncbi:hypothetical protein DdX_22328 [Ditylenchus destructor]|uniref:Uncharacterized protein n=1 Tax=Ditylenchus destructor TaxID=166010 RepID=A0AAD4MEI3_9BILA|nr:hypothetical protein DdX_22328 [Ditylenchus destructor]